MARSRGNLRKFLSNRVVSPDRVINRLQAFVGLFWSIPWQSWSPASTEQTLPAWGGYEPVMHLSSLWFTYVGDRETCCVVSKFCLCASYALARMGLLSVGKSLSERFVLSSRKIHLHVYEVAQRTIELVLGSISLRRMTVNNNIQRMISSMFVDRTSSENDFIPP